jgi:hypothetical protein
MVTNYYVRIPEEPVSERTPIFRNIAISNVTVTGAPVVVNIEGLPEMPIDGLRIRDLIGAGKRGLQAFNTKGLELHDVKIDATDGPSFLIRDSSDVELDHVESAKAKTGMPVVRLDRAVRTTMTGSRVWTGTPIFLSTNPGLLQSVHLDAGAPKEETTVDYWKGIDSPDRPRQQ